MSFKQLGIACGTKCAILYILVITMMTMSLVSCTNGGQPEDVSSMENQQSIASPPSAILNSSTFEPSEAIDTHLLRGISINELGYSFSVPSNFPNAVSPYYKERDKDGKAFYFHELDTDYVRWFSANWKGAGIVGYLEALIYEGRPGKIVLDIGGFPVFCTIALETNSITKDSFIRLGDEEYSVEKLENRILFEDNNIVVFDVTELVFDFTDYKDYLGRFCETDLPDVIWITSIRGNIRERYVDFFIKN